MASRRCSKRSVQIALLATGLAAMVGMVAFVFIRTHESASFPVPKKFSATLAVYEKLPNGSLASQTPWVTGEMHKDGDDVRATGRLSSGADGQFHAFSSVGAQAAYEVFFGNQLFDEEEPVEEDNEDADRERVACVVPGDAPSASDTVGALDRAIVVDQSAMLETVGPGACEGADKLFMTETSGMTLVVCQVSALQFEVVSTDFVAYVDATSIVNTAALNGITLPLADDGSDLNCPSLENVVIPTLTRALGSPRLRHQERRLDPLDDCPNDGHNSPPPGNCAPITEGAQAPPSCQTVLYQRNYVLYGWDHIHQGCTLEPCSDFQNFMKNKFGVQGLCSPLPGYDSRRLKKNKDDGNVAPFRSKVPSDERVTKCNAKHRTPTKRCLFVHGAGAPMPQNAFGSSLRNKFPRYWGPVHSHVEDSCTSVKFVHLPMADRSWSDESLARHFCYWATPARAGKDLNDAQFGEIEDTVIFAHGAGNLVVANAELLNLCSRAESTLWFEAQNGQHLSLQAKWNVDFCSEVSSDPLGDELDAHLNEAWMKRLDFMGEGAPKWTKAGDKEGWKAWRKQWRRSFAKDYWRKLRLRQLQRRANRRLGLCKQTDASSLAFPLSFFSFDQNAGWLSLVQDPDTAGTFSHRAGTNLDALSKIVRNGVRGSMCSDVSDNARHAAMYIGVKPERWERQDFELYEKPWSRCWTNGGAETEFEANPRNTAYAAPTSFFEITCRYGNPKGEGKDGFNRPCDWYHQMACTFASEGPGDAAYITPITIDDDDHFDPEELLAM